MDDSPATLEVVGRILREQGHTVETAADVPTAVRRLEGLPLDLVITDFRMPGPDGLDLIRHVRENLPATAVVMLTGFPSIEGAVEAVKGGAEAYLTKPFTQNELIDAVDGVLQTILNRRAQESGSGLPLPLLGRSDAARALRLAVDGAAQSLGPVLLEEKLGSGAPAVARAIHDAGVRRGRAFEIIDCDLLGDEGAIELFGGAERGSGAVERAEGGAVVLLNPCALDETAQLHLLRLLQEKRCVPVEPGRPRPLDVRVMAITRRDLARLTALGHFRRDLLERLTAIKISVPLLSDRKEDIVDLVRAIAASEAALHGQSPPAFSDRALEALTQTTWHGGLAELAGVVRMTVSRLHGATVHMSDLPPRLRFQVPTGGDEVPTLRDLEATHIRAVLDGVGGNKTEAARILGIDRKTLRAKLGVK